MGQNRTYGWEFKLQMVQLLEKGEQNPSQISRDHHVTRSFPYANCAACWGSTDSGTINIATRRRTRNAMSGAVSPFGDQIAGGSA